MAFEKASPVGLRPYNLDNPVDRGIVRAFEEELREYEGKSLVIFPGMKNEMTLKGIDLMFHEKGLMVFSEQYPTGAVRNIDEYRKMRMKWSALQKLQDRRGYMASMKPAMA